MNETTLAEAVEILCKALREDKDYYDSWKANIAVSIHDEFYMSGLNQLSRSTEVSQAFLTLFNKAAERFLSLLIKEKSTADV